MYRFRPNTTFKKILWDIGRVSIGENWELLDAKIEGSYTTEWPETSPSFMDGDFLILKLLDGFDAFEFSYGDSPNLTFKVHRLSGGTELGWDTLTHTKSVGAVTFALNNAVTSVAGTSSVVVSNHSSISVIAGDLNVELAVCVGYLKSSMKPVEDSWKLGGTVDPWPVALSDLLSEEGIASSIADPNIQESTELGYIQSASSSVLNTIPSSSIQSTVLSPLAVMLPGSGVRGFINSMMVSSNAARWGELYLNSIHYIKAHSWSVRL